MEPLDTGELDDILRNHAENMERAGICASRHKAIVDRLEELRQQTLQNDP